MPRAGLYERRKHPCYEWARAPATRPRGDTSVRIESVSHLSDSTLEQELENLAATDRGTTVRLLVHIAEFDARQLHVQRGYASMFALCGAPHRANYAEIGTMRR